MKNLQKMSFLIKNNKSFFIPFLIYIIFGLLILLATQRGDVVLFLNKLHNPFLDFLFKYFTMLGEGYYFLVIIIIMGLFRVKYFFQGFVLFSFSGLIATYLKNIFDEPRPLAYFGKSYTLQFVDGVDVFSWLSFPSGHSISAFTIFLFFSFHVERSFYKFIFFCLALLVAISRMYLVQHFFVDVYYGAIIGVICTTLMYTYIDNCTKLNNSKWYNKSFIKRNL